MSSIINNLLDIFLGILYFLFHALGTFLTGGLRLEDTSRMPGGGQALMPNGMMANFFNMFTPGGSGVGVAETAEVGFFKFLIMLGCIISFFIAIWNIAKPMLTPNGEVENPFFILGRFILVNISISFSYRITDFIISIGAYIYSYFESFAPNNVFEGGAGATAAGGTLAAGGGILAQGGLSQAIATHAATITTVSLGALFSLVISFVTLFLMISLFSSFMKYILEFFERYVLLGVISMFAPLLFAALTSKQTSRYFWSWFQMLISQVIVITLSILFLSVFFFAMNNYEAVSNGVTARQGLWAASGASSKGVGEMNIFVFVFLLMAWLRVGARMDSHLSTLGLTTAQASHMGSDIISGFWGANQIGKSLLPKDPSGRSQTFMSAISNEAKTGLGGIFNGRMNADATGRRSALTSKYVGAQMDKATKEGRKLNLPDVGNKAIPNALRNKTPISHVGDQTKDFLGLGGTNLKANNGGVDARGNLFLNGETENGEGVKVSARPLGEGEALKPGEVMMTGQDGKAYAATITGEGANDFITGANVKDGDQSAQAIMSAFGEGAVEMENKQGAVAENMTGAELMDGQLGEGSFVVTDKDGNQHLVDANTQFGEMTSEGFVHEGEKFFAETGANPMGLREDEEGFITQEMNDREMREITASANGFVDKDGNFVQMSRSEFEQAKLMSQENASNTGSLIRDTEGNFQKLHGGMIETNAQGQVAITNGSGEKEFITPHSSAVNLNEDGSISSFNTANAYINAGGKGEGALNQAEQSWKAHSLTMGPIENGTGIRTSDGKIQAISPNSIDDNGNLRLYASTGKETPSGSYVKTMGEDGVERFSHINKKDLDHLYSPVYSVAGGLQTNARGQFNVADIESVVSTKTGTAIHFRDGSYAQTHVAANMSVDKGYSTSGNIGSVQTGQTTSYLENNSAWGSLSNLTALQNPSTVDKGLTTLARDSDRSYIFDNLSDRSFLSDRTGGSIKAMHVNPDTGSVSIREHDMSGYMLLPKATYNKPADALSETSIAGTGYYVVKTHDKFNDQTVMDSFMNYKLQAYDDKTIDLSKHAMVMARSMLDRGQKNSGVAAFLDSFTASHMSITRGEVGNMKSVLDIVLESADKQGIRISPSATKYYSYNLTDAYGLTEDTRKDNKNYERYLKNVGENFKFFDNASSKPSMVGERASRSVFKDLFD